MARRVPQRTELEPACERHADLRADLLRGLPVDLVRGARGHGQKLCLARSFHRDEPPRGGGNRLSDGQQAVVLQDDGLRRAERLADAAPLVGVAHDSAIVGVEALVLEEGAGVLG